MYSQELADRICARLAEGESLRSICRDMGFSHSLVLLWAREKPEFANQYARAREIGDDAEFESLTDMAAEPPERTATGSVDPGWVSWQKNRIDVHKWSLARKRPKKYGDKVEQTVQGPDGAPVSMALSVQFVASGADSAAT
jgi:hypothetical protein